MMATRAKVEAALRREAARLDKANRGLHVFHPIQRTPGVGCNWTATYHTVASNTPFDELDAALERVQAKYPMVDFR